MRLKYNFHTHTYRCGHAKGTDEEYVINAIANGFKVLGFSDHVMLKGNPQPGIRGDYEQLDDYVKSIERLKKQYEDQITIRIGFEAEYYPTKVDYYKELLATKVEYLILGQHCYINRHGDFQWYQAYQNKEEGIDKYVNDLIEGMSTGLFKYVAHPDYFVRLYKEHNPIIEKYSRMICEASKKYDVPLEMNLGGIRAWYLKENNLHYPYPYFWKIAAEMGCKAVVGVDAHEPLDFSVSNYKAVFDMIEEFGINIQWDFDVI